MKRRDLITLVAGAAVAWPLAALAQRKAMPVIGFLGSSAAAMAAMQLEGFRQGLSDQGFVQGKDLEIEFRWADGHYDRLAALAADLISRNIDVIVAQAPPAARAAKTATATIPIVFAIGTDPVAEGLVASVARPGGNLTGVSLLSTDLMSKRLELLAELVPQAKVMALFINPGNPNPWIGEVQEAARAKGLQLQILKAATESDIDVAFASLGRLGAEGIVVGDDPFFSSRREQLTSLASRHAVPAIYFVRTFAATGGLMSYEASLRAVYRQAGIYAGRILNGAKPADLPVMQPDRFELVINLRTAKALGLTVPQSILARADEVIE
jgi:putative ABC transport system substrate-binding protein